MKKSPSTHIRRIACALATAWAGSTLAAPVSVHVLHSFTGVNGQPASATEAEKTGEGATPHAPPVQDPKSGRIVGAAQLGGYQTNLGVVYSLNPATGAAPDLRVANARAVSVNSPQITTDGDGTFYQGATYDIYKFMLGDLLPVAAVPQNSPRAGARGLWAFGTAGATAPSLYLMRNWTGGDMATRLHRYTPSTGSLVELRAWAMNPNLYASDFEPSALAIGSNGAVYGLLNSYYRHPAVDAAGTLPKPQIFRIQPDGSSHEVVVEFSDTLGLGYPATTVNAPAVRSALVDGGDGWLYGSTYSQQAAPVDQLPAAALGTIYRVSLTAKDSATGFNRVEVLHTFTGGTGGTGDGEAAHGPIVKAADGHLYGTTRAGGTHGAGTLWRVVLKDGAAPAYELLHAFTENVDGKSPVGLSLGADGWTLYGAAQSGGTHNVGATTSGTVFRVDITRPASLTAFTTSSPTTTVQEQATLNLSWASDNATACTAGGDNAGAWSGAQPTSGSAVPTRALTLLGSNTFTLSCSGEGGASDTRTLTVVVTAAPASTPTTPTTPETGGDSGGGPLSGLLLVPLLGLAACAVRARQARHGHRLRRAMAR